MTQMNRITLHHSGGPLKPTTLDKKHYHRIAGGDGEVISGIHDILDNAPGRAFTSGSYAAHTLNLNSGNIGLSMACMRQGEWSNPRGCPDFPTPSQIDAMLTEATTLCVVWKIAPDRKTLLSHAEVETTLGVKQKGKWDFDYSLLGKGSSRDPVGVGDEIRQEVAHRLKQEGLGHLAAPPAPTRNTIRRGAQGPDVQALQKALHLTPADGLFGPATHTAVVAFQKKYNLLPDGVVGRMTWAALGF